jgi:hypothetical protein
MILCSSEQRLEIAEERGQARLPDREIIKIELRLSG